MNINRGLLFWGLALVTAGATALAVQQDIIDRDLVDDAWRLWPVILIAIGLSIVLSRTPFSVLGTILAALVLGVAGGALVTVGPSISCTGDVPTDLDTSGGDFTGTSASVDLDFNCGELEVSMADGAGWTAGTAVSGDGEVDLEATGDSLDVRSPDREGWDWDGGKQRWEIGLGSDVTYRLNISANAADSIIDLAGGNFTEVDVDPNAGSIHFDLAGTGIDDVNVSMNAGSVEFQTDAQTAMAGSISVNAGSVQLCTAPDAAVRIRVDANITFSHNLDDSDLSRSGDTWTSDNFDGAERAIDLRISGNAASFNLNPEGGCS